MSLAAARGGSGSEKGEWSDDQLRWDAKEQEYKAEALTCRFGGGCRQGLNCPYPTRRRRSRSLRMRGT